MAAKNISLCLILVISFGLVHINNAREDPVTCDCRSCDDGCDAIRHYESDIYGHLSCYCTCGCDPLTNPPYKPSPKLPSTPPRTPKHPSPTPPRTHPTPTPKHPSPTPPRTHPTPTPKLPSPTPPTPTPKLPSPSPPVQAPKVPSPPQNVSPPPPVPPQVYRAPTFEECGMGIWDYSVRCAPAFYHQGLILENCCQTFHLNAACNMDTYYGLPPPVQRFCGF
ncbi:hypothetical protein M5689_014898 [Euphorbia peplus]|nr:hypothetical protein M5689_014898 [Euphorbia peplus]